jgi:hypothetical protein
MLFVVVSCSQGDIQRSSVSGVAASNAEGVNKGQPASQANSNSTQTNTNSDVANNSQTSNTPVVKTDNTCGSTKIPASNTLSLNGLCAKTCGNNVKAQLCSGQLDLVKALVPMLSTVSLPGLTVNAIPTITPQQCEAVVKLAPVSPSDLEELSALCFLLGGKPLGNIVLEGFNASQLNNLMLQCCL